MTPAEIVARSAHVLLDFDGPVCAVFGEITDRAVANELRAEGATRGLSFPADIAETSDPFEVLKFAAQEDASTAEQLEERFREYEVVAVDSAPATPGTPEFLERLAAERKAVTIVSNNSAAAVRRYLQRAGLEALVHGISARDSAEIQRLKPSPYLLQQAISEVGGRSGDVVMIGDSLSDIEAARAAGTAVIAYANKPGKRERFAGLSPDGTITSMAELWAD